MTIGQAFIEALESLSGNKLRSVLTVLGIDIGVAAVIAMLAVGSGAQQSITGSINSIGTNLLFIVEGTRGQEPVRNPRPLTLSDADAISDTITAPSIQAVAPALESNSEVTFGGEHTTATVNGVTPDYFAIRNITLTEGEIINEASLLGRASVAVIGPDLADTLFGHHDGITGNTIRIAGQPFRVIGVMESKGGSGFGGEDSSIAIPLSTAQVRINRKGSIDQVDIIFAQAVDAEAVPSASEEIAQILRQRHRTAVGEDDFTVFTQQDFLATASNITGILTVFLGGIAAISLLVGGIGIMNIMLVSVTERTREIGLRKALGARKRDIVIQFLTESSLLSLIGGIIGILFGWLIAFIVGRVAAANGTNFIPVVTMNAVALATIFSAAVGLFFGIYPANRAAGLEPVEALRYE